VPLGLAHLAAYLKRAVGDMQVSVLDNRLHGYSDVRLKERVLAFAPDAIGISSLAIEAPETHALAKELKRISPAPVILGGSYPSSAPEWAIEDENVDFIVRGEGEASFTELLLNIRENRGPGLVKGVSYRSRGVVVHNPPRDLIADIDTLPYPDFDALNIESYMKHLHGYSEDLFNVEKRTVPVMTSRGCSYGCINCHDVLGKKFRANTPGYVIDYLSVLVRRYGIKGVHVIDDTFNLDMGRAKEILRLIIDRRLGLNLSFPCGIRVDKVDDEMLDLFEAAGTSRIGLGIESGDYGVSKTIKKDLDLDVARRNIIKASKRKFMLSGFFMLGFPGENEENMRNTIRYACSLPLHTASFHSVVPYPGTGLEKMVPGGLDLKKLFFTSNPDFHGDIINLSAVPTKRLAYLRRVAVRKFYFNYSRIKANLSAAWSKYQLRRNFMMLLNWAFTDKP